MRILEVSKLFNAHSAISLSSVGGTMSKGLDVKTKREVLRGAFRISFLIAFLAHFRRLGSMSLARILADTSKAMKRGRMDVVAV